MSAWGAITLHTSRWRSLYSVYHHYGSPQMVSVLTMSCENILVLCSDVINKRRAFRVLPLEYVIACFYHFRQSEPISPISHRRGPPLIHHPESAEKPLTGVWLAPMVQHTLHKLDWQILTDTLVCHGPLLCKWTWSGISQRKSFSGWPNFSNMQ